MTTKRRRRNAPLKGVRQIGANMTEVEHGDLTILYSYKTPVAFLSPNGGYRTEQQWSHTTSAHIGKFFSRHGYDLKGAFKIPQADLERFVESGAVPSEGRISGYLRTNPKRQWFLWAKRDAGVYADEANGEEHRRDVLASLLNEVFSGPATVAEQERIPDLIEELEDEPSDDYGEEDEAMDILQAYTDPALMWEVDQDLLLRARRVQLLPSWRSRRTGSGAKD